MENHSVGLCHSSLLGSASGLVPDFSGNRGLTLKSTHGRTITAQKKASNTGTTKFGAPIEVPPIPTSPRSRNRRGELFSDPNRICGLGDGPLAQVVFGGQPVSDYRSGLSADKRRGRAVMLELFRQGIFLNPMGTKLYLSLAHKHRDCDEFLEKFDSALNNTCD